MGKGTMLGMVSVLTFTAVTGACSGGETSGHGGAGGTGATSSGGSCRTDDDCMGQLPQTTPADCAKPTCDPLAGVCSLVAKDADGDGHGSAACVAVDGSAVVAGDDCDDADAALFPGHPRDCSESGDGTAIVWPTGAPVGSCAYGSQACKSDGSVGACIGSVAPAPRDCASSEDNDCDGHPDNTMDVVCACQPGVTYDCSSDSMGTIVWPTGSWGDGPAPNSICHTGTALCGADGHLMTCGGAQRPEARDCGSTNDNDCDGLTDRQDDTCKCNSSLVGDSQACGAHPGLDGHGVCHAGLQHCIVDPGDSTHAHWDNPSCSDSVGPLTVACGSPNDNDCNGTADNQDSACACPGGYLPGQPRNCTVTGQCGTGTEICIANGSSSAFGSCTGTMPPSMHSTPGSPPTIGFTDSTGEHALVGTVSSPAGAFPGTWKLTFTMSQNGNVDNTHGPTDPAGPAGIVKCSDNSAQVNVGSSSFSGGAFNIVCPVGIAVQFYKWTNWGGGCCGGYNRYYNIGAETYTGCM